MSINHEAGLSFPAGPSWSVIVLWRNRLLARTSKQMLDYLDESLYFDQRRLRARRGVAPRGHRPRLAQTGGLRNREARLMLALLPVALVVATPAGNGCRYVHVRVGTTRNEPVE